MKMYKKVLATLLTVILLVTAFTPVTKVNADTNVTITCKDSVMYELLVSELSDKIVSKDDTALTFVMTQTAVDSVKNLSLSNYYNTVGDITGIEKFTNLENFSIRVTYINTGEALEGSFSDLTPLASLKKLKTLGLYGCDNIDFTIISNLTNLTSLGIEGAKNADYTSISNLTNLESLSLITCNIDNEEFKEICKLTKLTSLSLGGPNYENNTISDISPIVSLTKLTNLNISNNEVTDITPLSTLTNLKELHIRCNPITDITPLGSLVNLTGLRLGRDGYAGSKEGVPIEGKIDVLSKLTNLTTLEASHCGITDISVLSSLTKLRDLDLSENSILDFSPIESLNISDSWLNICDQVYTYNVDSGQVVALPQVLLDAMDDTTSFVYTPDLTLSLTNCTLSDDGKSVIIGNEETAVVNAKYRYWGYKYSARIQYNVKDVTAPTVEVTYSTKELTNEDVTVTITADEELNAIEGFTKVDAKTYTKTYAANATEAITVTDLVGNDAVAQVVITNIDKVAPTVVVTYDNTEVTNKDVTVTLTADKEINAIEGFTKVDAKTYKKVYTANATEAITVTDVAGNDAVANVVITNIDKVAPIVEVTYDNTEVTNKDVTVTLTANEDIKEIEGFTKVDAKTYKKVYTANATEAITVTDVAGNDAVAQVVITNIDKVAPTVEVTYSTKELTNKDVTVTLTANEDIKEIEGFTKVDEKTYTKTYVANVTESVEVLDVAGNPAVAEIVISNIKVEQEKPVTPNTPDIPDTGDNNPFMVYALLMLLSGAIVISSRKKQEQ